jgi:hypothetical protein
MYSSFAEVCITISPYIAAELPANLLLRKIGPKTLMPALLTLWGVMVTLQGKLSIYGFIFSTLITSLRRAGDFVSGFSYGKSFSGPSGGTNVPWYSFIPVRILYPQRTLASVS